MRRLSINILSVITIACVSACGRSGDTQPSQYVKSDDFPSQVEATVDTLGIPFVAQVSQILSADSLIRIKAEGTPMWVYALKSDDLSVVDSILPKGSGPDEYLYPAIASVGNSDDYLIVDNGKMIWCLVGQSGVKESGQTGHFAINDIRDMGFPRTGYVDMRPDGLYLRIRDMRERVEIDSLYIPNIDIEGQSVNDSFVWDYAPDSRRVALAFTNQNKILTAMLTDDGFDDIKIYTGESLSQHLYYTDVKIEGDRLMALSQSAVDLSTFEGHSTIEVYTLDLQPEHLVNLPVIAQTMTADRLAKRIIMTSATDDVIYFYK